MGEGVLLHYKSLLPITPHTPLISLGEGDTPLVRSRYLEQELGCGALYFKLEGCNPTGSFKDRGMVVAVAKALEEGSPAIMCASTGNTSASAAAYGAYCSLQTIALVPRGDVAQGKLAQAIAYGARIVVIDGTFDRALEVARALTERHHVTLVNSVNPYRLEGQKTAAFEIVDQLGDAPDYVCIPVGNAGNITAYWKGFCEYYDMGRAGHRPRMMGFEAQGAAPIVRGEPVAAPQTVASAIRIGNPASWRGATNARDQSGGILDTVSDEEILAAYTTLARREGIFCEPASAASVAGLVNLSRSGTHLKDRRIVCVITGTGLKDPELATQCAEGPLQHTSGNPEEVEELLGLGAPSDIQRGNRVSRRANPRGR